MDNLNTSEQNNTATDQGNSVMPEVVTPAENSISINPENSSSVGPIIGSVIIVLVIVLGGLYFYGQRLSSQSRQDVPIENASADADQSTAMLEQQGLTDSLNEINQDLDTTDLSALDAETVSINDALIAQ